MGVFDYPYDFSYEADSVIAGASMGVFGIVMVIYAIVMLFAFAWIMLSYVLYSLGINTIANRRGIRHSWLAWIPLGNLWVLGSISDQYQYVKKGKVKNRRKILLGLSIGLFAGYFVWLFATLSTLAMGREGMALLLLILGGMTIVACAILLTVYAYLAYYDLYMSCDPGNAVLFLVLSIFFSVTMPFFVFACRKKDLGMPPRKQPVPQQVVVPTVEVVVDPDVVETVVVPTVEPVVDPDVVETVVVPTVEPVTEEDFARPEEFEEE